MSNDQEYLITTNLNHKLNQVNQYLSQRLANYPAYQEIINQIELLQIKINNYQLKIAIAGHQEKLINQVQTISLEQNFTNFIFNSYLLPDNLEQIINNCDLILLVVDTLPKNIMKKGIVQKAIAKKLPLAIISQTNCDSVISNELKIFTLESANISQSYQAFIQSYISQSVSYRELKFKQEITQLINQYFEQAKAKLWQTIVHRKEKYLSGSNPEQIQQIINQLPNRCNRLAQNYLRVCKQSNNQNKLILVNPFANDSLMYQMQNIIKDGEVITQKENKIIYLSLILKKPEYTQSLHSYIIDICEQSLTEWLNTEWSNIETNYNNGGLNQLIQELQVEIEPLSNLCQNITLTKSPIQPQLPLNNYVHLSALENNSKIPFDYHYTNSTWFRLLVAAFIGTVIFIFSQRLFGFILLLVQIINLITGQDAKSIKLRQQTKELKRMIDNKYQFLVRFLADKLTQDIAIALEDINQDYQGQIEKIAQEANQQITKIKQENIKDRETIDKLKNIHKKIQEIIK